MLPLSSRLVLMKHLGWSKVSLRMLGASHESILSRQFGLRTEGFYKGINPQISSRYSVAGIPTISKPNLNLLVPAQSLVRIILSFFYLMPRSLISHCPHSKNSMFGFDKD